MMTDISLEFNHIWKKFKKGEKYDSLRDFIPAVTKRIFLKSYQHRELQKKEFWALKDISFKIRRGEALGIIGPNGAGKSTILKILSDIIKPNKGSKKVNGRLSALIEVGAGFHPDLTGKENIYLNGSILGMKRDEIEQKFDEIVEFSGLAEFIDTPVKRFSSGMYARLGFSVAAHMDPDVLLVDEVLSVGDLSFQRKCTEKMQSFIQNGTTIIFISHNLDAVRRLCPNAILLIDGKISFKGSSADAIEHYLKSVQEPFIATFNKKPISKKDSLVKIEKLKLYDKNNIEKTEFRTGNYVRLEINYSAAEKIFQPSFAIGFFCNGQLVADINSRIGGYDIDYISGHERLNLVINKLLLLPGFYEARVHIQDRDSLSNYAIESILFFVKEGKRGKGIYYQPHSWEKS
jgi:lipopolysaccharide transport system ATP-binding protein